MDSKAVDSKAVQALLRPSASGFDKINGRRDGFVITPGRLTVTGHGFGDIQYNPVDPRDKTGGDLPHIALSLVLHLQTNKDVWLDGWPISWSDTRIEVNVPRYGNFELADQKAILYMLSCCRRFLRRGRPDPDLPRYMIQQGYSVWDKREGDYRNK